MEQDFLPINGTDYVEFYVGNAKQSALFYQHCFGYELIAYSGPETGVKGKASYVLKQDKIRLVLTSSLEPNSIISEHVKQHGDGVKVLALWVDDATRSYNETTVRGAESAIPPQTIKDEFGEVVVASIKTYGETIHTFVERKNYKGPFLPGFKAVKSTLQVESIGLKYIDHCVGNVELGQMNKWVKFYEDVMGFKLLITFDDKDISTEYSALMSKVVSNGNGYIKFPINEPAKGKKKSQIEEYLDFYHTAGVQHIAIATDDIIHTVGELRKRGVEFLYVPDSYYEDVLDRVGEINEDLEELKA
ncbi:MAG: 4-hydroxyphenylpyruvate dioxygenase, partial [Cyclobacteriaceae bacterium]|nr:4-hydroxyphenylpyruvate dioxygenase [Cyclobacteriaceae bacterium]